MYKNARNILALGAAVIAAAACGGGGSGSDEGPMIGSMQSVTVNQDTTAAVTVPVTDKTTMVSALAITAAAANGSLVLPQGIVLKRDSGGPTLYVTPAEDATGSSVIQVLATDPQGRMAQQSFTFTVNAVDVSFATFSQGVLGKSETDPPSQVSGFTFVQDADDTAAFDSVLQ